MIDSFIPLELTVAPNPLGLCPNLKLITVPIDAHVCFELWLPTTNRALLPEEAALLRGDRDRLEEICARLAWFLGARLTGGEAASGQSLIYSWREVQRLLQQSDLVFNALAVNYSPQIICPDLTAGSWTLCPISWKIAFLNLQATEAGFDVEVLPINLSIAAGERLTRFEQSVAIAAES